MLMMMMIFRATTYILLAKLPTQFQALTLLIHLVHIIIL